MLQYLLFYKFSIKIKYKTSFLHKKDYFLNMNTAHLCNWCLIADFYKGNQEFKSAPRELLPGSAPSPKKLDLTSRGPPTRTECSTRSLVPFSSVPRLSAL